MPATGKALFISEESIGRFLLRPDVWYWTFTFEENLQDKEEAERRLKGLHDRISRMDGEELHVWELQKRGAWHLHMLVDCYLDVGWLRPFMCDRGWGRIMKGIKVQKVRRFDPESKVWLEDLRETEKLTRYLVKYLRKGSSEQGRVVRELRESRISLESAGDPERHAECVRTLKKKLFGGHHGAMIGNTRFAWCPWIKAGAFLYAYGREMFFELYGRLPNFFDIRFVLRLGYEVCDWAKVDPWYFECLGFG